MTIDARAFSPAIGLAGLFNDPTPERAGAWAGNTLTNPSVWKAGLDLAENGLPTLADLGTGIANAAGSVVDFASNLPGSLAGAGAGLASSAAMLPFSMFAGGGPLKLLLSDGESSDTLRRRWHRNRDAQGLERGVLEGAARGDLSAPVGGSTTGDAIAAILKNTNDGTWYTDTAHGQRPDPYLYGAQQWLRDRGYTGATEPKAGDVGGVGEMVMGGTTIAPWEAPAKEHFDVQGNYTWAEPGYRSGPRGWNAGLRRLFNVDPSAPSVWDFDKPLSYTPDTNSAEGGQIRQKTASSDYADFQHGGAAETDPANSYVQYLDALEPDMAGKMREYERKKYAQQQAVNDSVNNVGGG